VKTIAVVLTLAIFPESLYQSHIKSPVKWGSAEGDLSMGFPYGLSLMLHKMAVASPVLWIIAATTMPLAIAQEAALSEGERHGLAACMVKCPDGDKACVNVCMSKSQTKGVVWSDATRTCIRACRTGHQLSQVAAQNAANELVFGCVASCLDQMVR
jgi:hypothetical protein